MEADNVFQNNYIDFDTSSLSIDEIKNLELKLQTQSKRQRFIKIEILDENNDVVTEVSGTAISGNYNIDSSAAIRRTCSVSFKLEYGYLPSETSPFWINKKFQLYIGLKQFETNQIYWFNKGQYAIKDPTINLSISEKSITINGLDKMALHNGDISGQLYYNTIIETESGAYVHDAIRAIMQDGGEVNLLIANTDLKIPYKIESSIGDTRYTIISELTDLFYNYQVYYNLDGYFVFEEKPAYQSNGNIINDIAINFSKEYINDILETKPYNLIISLNREIAYSNIKNKIVVYGGVHDDGYQPSYEILIESSNYPNSPYAIDKLNEKNSDGTLICRTLVVQDDSYVDDGNTEEVVNTILVQGKEYNVFALETEGYSQINLPSYYTIDISLNNAWGIANEKQGLYYDVIFDDVDYTNLIPKKFDDATFYIGNVYILENIYKSGMFTEDDDSGEPFVCWYNNGNCGVYVNNNMTMNQTEQKHMVKITKKENTNHAYSINLCKKRAEQEVYLHQQATEKVTITCLPIYSLDVNKVVYLNDSESGAVGEYVVNSISCGLGVGDTMSITLNKLW